MDEARAALRQYPADLMTAYPVSTRVNTPKNNDEKLIERHESRPHIDLA
jgi:putative SOS response-associated peptidase YedK